MPKNVLIIHTDQQRYNSMGCTGNPFARTPNLDRLAAGGAVFDRHIAANTICMPSRASLLTGLYPPGHNVWCNGVALNRAAYFSGYREPDRPENLPEPPTMADVFSAHDYQTACFGKLHLTPFKAPAETGFHESSALWKTGALNEWQGPYFGFQQAELIISHGQHTAHAGHYAQWLERAAPDIRARMLAPIKPISEEVRQLGTQPIPFEMHNSRWLAGRFAAYLENRDRKKPFFAFVGFPDPHHPFCPAEDIFPEFKDMDVEEPVDADGEAWTGLPVLGLCQETKAAKIGAQTRRMVLRATHAMNHQIDIAVGMIIDALKRDSLWDDTIIAFTSDHGDFLFDHGLLYKGFGGCDPLLHVPFILRAPGANLPRRVSVPMSNCDVLPTVAALAGIELQSPVHGRDILPAIRERVPHVALAYNHDGQPEHNNITVYDERFRLTFYPARNAVEMFDHKQDPHELGNLADSDAARQDRDRLMRIIAESLTRHHNPILARWSDW